MPQVLLPTFKKYHVFKSANTNGLSNAYVQESTKFLKSVFMLSEKRNIRNKHSDNFSHNASIIGQ